MTQWLRRNAEAQANLFVINASTPAQLFHVLRRQMNRPFTKPLILLSPKYLLHHRRATSALEVVRLCQMSFAAEMKMFRAQYSSEGEIFFFKAVGKHLSEIAGIFVVEFMHFTKVNRLVSTFKS